MSIVRHNVPTWDQGTARQKTWIAGSLAGDVILPYSLRGIQKTWSEGHDWPPRKNFLMYDRGGPFFTQKISITDLCPNISKTWTGTSTIWKYNHEGRFPIFGAILNYGQNDLPPLPSNNDVTYYGTDGYRRASLLRPAGSLAQGLYELKKEGVPGFSVFKAIYEGARSFRDLDRAQRLIRHRLDDPRFNSPQARAKALADGYVSYWFAYVPFYREVQTFCKNIGGFEGKFQKLLSGSNKNTRRRRTLLDTTNTVSSEIGSVYGNFTLGSPAYISSGVAVKDTVTRRKVEYSASFAYYVPNPHGTPAERLRYSHLLLSVGFGLELTPRALWSVMPWSWLADWCGSTGNSFSNLTDMLINGQASQYNYVMIEDETQIISSLRKNIILADSTSLSGRQVITKITKTRYQGSAFGFALKPGDFTPKQWGILAALGISRGAGKV